MSQKNGWNLASGAAVALGSTLVFTAVADAGGANWVHVDLVKVDDLPFNETGFFVWIEVNVSGVADVAGVNVITPNSTLIALEADGKGSWFEEVDFADLASVKTEASGQWSILLDTPFPNLTTFTIDASSLGEGDFFPTPTVTNPVHGATGVPLDVTFSWTDTTGKAVPDAISVSVDQDPLEQGENSITGTIGVDDTSWTAPAPLPPGFNEFAVSYHTMVDPAAVGPLAVSFGGIAWGNSPFAPKGYPASTPLVVLGSEAIISFDAGEPVNPCPSDIDGSGATDVNDLLAVILDWGTDGSGNNGDVDGSGLVDVDDILAVILNWGACGV
jgi:hypothetical protein